VPSNPQTLQGVEAVIDKDRCGGKLANELDADGYIILTDGGGIWQNFGKPDAREMSEFFATSSSCLMCVYIIIRTLFFSVGPPNSHIQSHHIHRLFLPIICFLPPRRNVKKNDRALLLELATPEYLLGKKAGKNFPGSMGPKIQAAIDFVQNSKKEGAWAAIGDLRDASKMFTNEEGTLIKKDVRVAEGVVWRESKVAAGTVKLTRDQSKYG